MDERLEVLQAKPDMLILKNRLTAAGKRRLHAENTGGAAWRR